VQEQQQDFHVYKEPLSPVLRRVLLASVIFFHVGAGYALTQFEPTRLIVGDVAPMEVSFVSPPAPPSPPEPEPPPPEPPPELESMIQPQPDDLPPPVFPVEAPPPKPTPPKPPPPKPRQVAAPPSEAPPQPSAPPPAQQSGPKTVTDAQVGYLTRPSPIYPMRSKRAGEQGTVMVRVLVDPSGRPSQVVLQKSSGHQELDESALSALRAARFRPFVDAGVASAVWVICPIGFALQ
jgi:protein TonB